MTAQRKLCLTPQEYLEIGRVAGTKSETYEGEVLAMAGARTMKVVREADTDYETEPR